MKAVLISIQAKWCAEISALKKKVEIRKTKPTGNVPFKAYIYCTKGKTPDDILTFAEWDESGYIGDYLANGAIIGEFVCDEITEYEGEFYDDETQESIKKVIHGTDWDGYPELDYSFIAENGEENELCKSSCLTWEELRNYMGAGINTFYGWHISDLVIYDKPKELSEFERACPDNVRSCAKCRHSGYSGMKCLPLTRPPQSWCYVEEEG